MILSKGMDGAVRKTDRHLEREPEWEAGVTLQMRLVTITRLILSWCSTSVSFRNVTNKNSRANKMQSICYKMCQ